MFEPTENQPLNARPKALALLGSRKFWAALIGLTLLVVRAFAPNFPLSEDQLTNVVYLLAAYILGTAVEDSGLAAAKKRGGNGG